MKKLLNIIAGVGRITLIDETRINSISGIPLPPTNILGQVAGQDDLVMYMDHQYNEVVMRSIRHISIPRTALAMDGDSGEGPDAHIDRRADQ